MTNRLQTPDPKLLEDKKEIPDTEPDEDENGFYDREDEEQKINEWAELDLYEHQY